MPTLSPETARPSAANGDAGKKQQRRLNFGCRPPDKKRKHTTNRYLAGCGMRQTRTLTLDHRNSAQLS